MGGGRGEQDDVGILGVLGDLGPLGLLVTPVY